VEVLVLSTFATEPECLLDVRIIGALERAYVDRNGNKVEDVKIIAVQSCDPRTEELEDVSSLNPQVIKHLSHLFTHSAEMGGGSDCKIARCISGAEAISKVQACRADYEQNVSDKAIYNAPNLLCLPWGKDSSQGPVNKRVFPAIVEATKHATNRYAFDSDSGVLKCLGPLKTASFYPANAGFIPQTIAEDGKPVDVLILSSLPLQSRCVVEIRIVGAAECIDEMGPDIKVIAVPKSEPRMKEWDGIEAVPKHIKDELVQFLNSYKDLDEEWKFCSFGRWYDSDEAVKYVQGAHSRFFLFDLPMKRLEKRVAELEAENSALRGGY
jgi:inorganic pyrophosphatase